MELFIPESVKTILMVGISVAFILSRLARWFPDVAWLQVFRLPEIPMSEEQRKRRRRSGNRLAGMEMVLAGIVLPLLYFASTIMFFNELQMLPTIIVMACSIVCITLGIWIFVRNW